jgi:type II secretory ATPase GspE/PulE/Tfp pilus assembly ATPase PilB-like protein/CRP-like cAMP-binding protein
MGDPFDPTASVPPQATAASAANAFQADPGGALREGIVRVKVPADKIAPFLAAKTSVFKSCSKETVSKVAALVEGLECAQGSEVVSAGKVNDGFFVLFSGKAQILLPGPGGELVPVETVEPGEHFGEVGALLRKPSPFYVIARVASRILWMPSAVVQGLIANVPAVGDAMAKRLAERLIALAQVHISPAPEVMTDLEAQLLQLVESIPLTAQSPEPQGPAPVAFHELRDFDLSPSVLTMVPVKLVRQFRLLPVKLAGKVLTVAMVNPRDQAALAELSRTLVSVEIVPVAIGLEDFTSALVRLKLDDNRGTARTAGGPRLNPDSFTFETIAEREDSRVDRAAVGDDAIRLVNRIIAAGIERESSDIHLEPTAQGFRVRLRTNGILQDWNEQLPAGASLKGITARIKVLAGLDITERRLPQDGRIGLNAGRREIDLRVSTLPANRGEKIVLRILEAAGSTRQLEQIFFEPNVLTAVRKALNRPYGGIVVAGPTGSGKTSSMYSILNERKVTRPDTNIIMVEDPIEYRLPAITQVQVNMAVGLGFAQVLRSMLRQDPDVIVVGEMRDEETAQIALESAMTGHLLLTSLHANNAVSALARLENLGCSRALVAQSIQLVLVQRLVRKLCSNCRTLDPVLPVLHETLVARKIVGKDDLLLPRAVGCDACAGTGYIGRAAILECLQVTDGLREAIASGKSFAEVRNLAVQEKALLPAVDYARFLLQKQVISASEVLASMAE